MALVTLKDVNLAFGGPMLLEGADLQIERGERICLIGRNGTGKSTLLKLIHGEHLPDRGTVTREPGLKTAMLPQEVPLDLGERLRRCCLRAPGECRAARRVPQAEPRIRGA